MQSADDLTVDRQRVQAAAEGSSVSPEAASVVRVAIRQVPLDLALGKRVAFQSRTAASHSRSCVLCIMMNVLKLPFYQHCRSIVFACQMLLDLDTHGRRVRPLLPREVADGARECVQVGDDEASLIMGRYHQFTFDRVFGPDAEQVGAHHGVHACWLHRLQHGLHVPGLQSSSMLRFEMPGAA
jgi:hypothetical protein